MAPLAADQAGAGVPSGGYLRGHTKSRVTAGAVRRPAPAVRRWASSDELLAGASGRRTWAGDSRLRRRLRGLGQFAAGEVVAQDGAVTGQVPGPSGGFGGEPGSVQVARAPQSRGGNDHSLAQRGAMTARRQLRRSCESADGRPWCLTTAGRLRVPGL